MEGHKEMNWARQYAQQGYLARYEDAVRLAFPALSGGTVLLPFPRLFIVASRS